MFFTPNLAKRLRLQAAEIRQVIRGIDETLVEVVNDIDALVGAASKSLCRIHQQFYLVVILLRYVIYLIGMEEEVISSLLISRLYNYTFKLFILAQTLCTWSSP